MYTSAPEATMQPATKPTRVPESVLADMRRTNAVFEVEVVGKRNFAALDRVYTSHARALPPGAPMVEGREAIKTFWKQAISGRGITGAKLTIVEAEEAGDGVVEIGRADLALSNGQTVDVKYVVHWKQEDGSPKWNIDIWNANQ
jgi:ketosteroid isomerase-like protein